MHSEKRIDQLMALPPPARPKPRVWSASVYPRGGAAFNLETCPDRRAFPSEVQRVIPSYVLTELEAMRATLNDADRRALNRRFTGETITQIGDLA